MKNKTARQILEMIYGKGCMFQKARIASRIEAIRGIKTYKKYVEETRYKPKMIKKLESTMTYHHLRHKFNGGRTDERNGAVVNELAHRYLHSLPREQEEIINNMLREYKMSIGGLIVDDDGVKLEDRIELEFSLSDDCIEIPLKDKKRKFERSKVKQDTRRMIEEYYEGIEI